MKILIPLFMTLPFAVGATDQKGGDLATVVIQSESLGGYNPLDRSEEELNKAAAFNSAGRLQHIMLHEVSDPELKVCYALRVLDSQIATSRQLAADKNNQEGHLGVLLKRQAELAKQLRAIWERKAKQGGTANGNQPTFAAEPERLTGLPSPNNVLAIAVTPHSKDFKDYFTPESLLQALPKLVSADVQLPAGTKWQSGVIVLKDKTVLFWRTCGDWFIAIDRRDGTSFYAMPKDGSQPIHSETNGLSVVAWLASTTDVPFSQFLCRDTGHRVQDEMKSPTIGRTEPRDRAWISDRKLLTWGFCSLSLAIQRHV
jgi:hypothetical protein